MRIGAGPLTVADLVAVARAGAPVELAPQAEAAVAAGHAALLALVRDGAAIYGVSTGLGAAVDIAAGAATEAWQQAIPRARSVGIGRVASREQVRAIMAARAAGLGLGRSGASPAILAALIALLNQGVHPVIKLIGSVGEADLPILAPVASVLGGEGEAELEGAVLPAAAALARAGIAAPAFGPKDGLALVSSNAGAVGMAALVAADAARALEAALGAAALSLEGFRGSLWPFDPRAAGLRPAPLQAETAARVRALLAGGALDDPAAARRLQDPLSFRALASVHGAAAHGLRAATEAVELELNSSDDNPAIVDGIALPNANFDPTHLVLAFESLGQALLRVAVCSAGRVLQLMSPATSGLPRFLAPVQDGRNGFATVQKTVAALVAEMQHAAAPMPAVLLPAADHVEDYGTMATAVVEKTAALVERLVLLVGVELMVAAQACDLRGPIRLGAGTRALHGAVRARVSPLGADRRTGPDIEALAAMVRDGALPTAA